MDISALLKQPSDSTRGAFRNIALPVLSILETIATSKASKGRYVGTTAADLMKNLEVQDAQRAKALDRLLQAQDRESDNKRADRGLDIQEKASKRLEGQARAERDEAERKSHETETAANRKLALTDRLLSPPTMYNEDEKTILFKGEPVRQSGVVTMGKGIRFPKLDAKGEQIWEGDSPAFDLPSLLDRALIRKDPEKWLDSQAKDPVADFKAKWDYQIKKPKATTGPSEDKPPTGYRWAADGSLEPIPGGPATIDKPATEDQSKAANFARRMELAMSDLQELEDGGFNRASSEASARSGSLVPNFMNSKEGQRYSNAEKNFASANLRKESGAVIGRDEMLAQEALYFPRHGDTPENIEQKARNRAQAFAGMRAAAGKHFDKIPSMIPIKAGRGRGKNKIPARPAPDANQPPSDTAANESRRSKWGY